MEKEYINKKGFDQNIKYHDPKFQNSPTQN
jgi:hypothetical protein